MSSFTIKVSSQNSHLSLHNAPLPQQEQTLSSPVVSLKSDCFFQNQDREESV